MFLSLELHSLPGQNARDLGFLLHKHPDNVHTAQLSFGTAHVFYPRADEQVCTAALWVEVEPSKIKQIRRDSFSLSGYINDRKWAASSLLAVALRSVFSTAMAGRLTSRPELPQHEFELRATIAAVQTTPAAAAEVFEPLGWSVDCQPGPDGLAPHIHLQGRSTVQALLNQLYILIPVLDGGKHYWVDETEIDKLLDKAGTWLGQHPQRDSIMRRYLAEQQSYVKKTKHRLGGGELGTAEEQVAGGHSGAGEQAEAGEPADPPLRVQRRDRVVREVQRLRPRVVVDIGCGSGALISPLLTDPRIAQIIGTDVALAELQRAREKLGLDRMPERQAARLSLIQSSVTYVDERIADCDVAVLMEVIEHLDPDRLPALASSVFGYATPQHVIVTTPNAEYNVHYPALTHNEFRHPDHRFEFTREEFAAWAASVCEDYGYLVDIDGIGPAQPAEGAPTQIAVFSRTFTDLNEAVPADKPAAEPAAEPTTVSPTQPQEA